MDTQTAAPFGTFCNLEHLFHAMAARKLDGIVATQPLNVYYLSRFNGIAHKSDEPRPYAVVISRHAPDHPILVIADYYLSTAAELAVPISDIRPFRAVMMPLDLPPAASDVDRFIDAGAASRPWIDAARAKYRFTMGEALADALGDLGLTQGRVGFDDLGFGHRLGLEGPEIADA
ncbi:MAG: aminopeptidase P family N-terminal domain-containing protein, partial [Pseudomonadota bacterium]|nr:aminopeptidase P family N-terminal domain-containing protein [Pseudomonadota bacterium]